jgi:hypothetical protein
MLNFVERDPSAPKATSGFDEQKKKNSAAEKAYKDALRRISDQKVSDPWSTVW